MDLLDEIQHKAFLFFWEQADPHTGLINDRAGNFAAGDYRVASIASTGYGLAALPVGVERGWIGKTPAAERARATLRFLLGMAHQHGWMVHFVEKQSGEQAWNSEYSTIDTALLMAGVLVCSQYFQLPDITEMSAELHSRLDWRWVLTNDGAQPEKQVVSHGWRIGIGFIPNNWVDYSEAVLLYMLGLGAPEKSLPGSAWEAFERPLHAYAGLDWLRAGPIFIHQMPYCYFDLRDQRDRLGFDYWTASAHANKVNRLFCRYRTRKRKTYAEGFWGLNASDGPDGYKPYGVLADPKDPTSSVEDGTVSPTGVIASVMFDPEPAISAAHALRRKDDGKLWGRYGFSNAFNVDRQWHSPDVIGIDLGMALLAIENHRTGLIWSLLHQLESTRRALAAAGFRKTTETGRRTVRG